MVFIISVKDTYLDCIHLGSLGFIYFCLGMSDFWKTHRHTNVNRTSEDSVGEALVSVPSIIIKQQNNHPYYRKNKQKTSVGQIYSTWTLIFLFFFFYTALLRYNLHIIKFIILGYIGQVLTNMNSCIAPQWRFKIFLSPANVYSCFSEVGTHPHCLFPCFAFSWVSHKQNCALFSLCVWLLHLAEHFADLSMSVHVSTFLYYCWMVFSIVWKSCNLFIYLNAHGHLGFSSFWL